VRGDGAPRVAELEPPLMPDHVHVEWRLEAAERRASPDLAEGDEAQREDDGEQRERRGGPHDLERPMSVDLRGWPCSDVAIAHGEHDERDEDGGEDDRRDGTD